MTTKEMIAVMQASEEGKTIEYRWNRQYKPLSLDGWESHAEPSWNWAEFEYRVKPEPMEIEVMMDKDGNFFSPKFYHSAAHSAYQKKRFREVIE